MNRSRWFGRVGWFAVCVPLIVLVAQAVMGRLGANPLDAVTDTTGTWTLRLLVLTLAVTPLRRLAAAGWLAPLRRTLGLAAFGYGCLHLLTYVWFDQFFNVPLIVRDISKRPFIAMGLTAWLLMVPLAVTSGAWAMRRLGGVRWRRLHRLAYLAAAAGVVHYWWLVKADIRRPLAYCVVLAILLATRAWSTSARHP